MFFFGNTTYVLFSSLLILSSSIVQQTRNFTYTYSPRFFGSVAYVNFLISLKKEPTILNIKIPFFSSSRHTYK